MTNPKTILAEWVTALQALPNLVDALGGDGSYIQFYTENAVVFGQPTQNNIRLAILSMPPGSIMIAWQGTRVVHVLRMPTAKEMQDHERASTSVVAARRSIETRAFLEPSGALYDKLHISHDGYAGAVPIVHKSAAVSEVIAQLAIEADEDPE